MPGARSDATDGLSAEVARRWRAVDALLPEPPGGEPGCGAALLVTDRAGRLIADGSCEHSHAQAGSLDLTWGAAHQFRLTARVAGPDPGHSLDQLLALWREHLAAVPGTGDSDTSAVVTWPSRDVCGVQALLRHGFAPLAVIAARRTGGQPAERSADLGDPGIQLRRAGQADIDAVVSLGFEVIAFDAQVCSVTLRPDTAPALRHDCAALLAEPQPWAWLAERAGDPVGMLIAEPPATAAWIAPLAASAPVAYLLLAGVQPGERGRGIGAALTAQYHHDSAEAGVQVSLLHYAQVNPLSAPFWSQQGYRPLWTVWEARPASTAR
ncbi:MAG TPA: GNAT family N-acetyltransferase [Streptosporangiaceae bacterium]|nr:GNAT family N-acetyltransferase [Streptosporangiaceae bacterium]